MVHAVIMAGGSGTRFWPQSRTARPKQVLSIAGPRPMIAETVMRLEGLVPIERTTIVTHESQVGHVLAGLGVSGPPPRIIAEPFGRDTAACIGLAAVHIRREDPDGVMLILAADHVIRPAARFLEVTRAAAEVATEEACLVTFGIKPSTPATGYGYVHRGALVRTVGDISVYDVHGFREKPAREVADEYIASGEYYWNSGMFCWRADVILDCLRRFTPELYGALERIEAAIATPAEETVLREAYEPLEKISIDYAVMEHAETIRVVEADYDWSDVGSWASVAALRSDEADERGNVVVGQGFVHDADDTLVISDDDHLVGVLGMEGVVVVHTPDATLVCPRERAEEVKKLVEQLQARRMDKYL